MPRRGGTSQNKAIQAKIAAKFGNTSSRTGGRGSVRRKFKAPPKSSMQDDKRLQGQLKKLNVNPIPAIEEVNLFKDDNTVVHFTKPKVQAEISSNTYVISGQCETKKLEELIPQILPQLGREHIDSLKVKQNNNLKYFSNHFYIKYICVGFEFQTTFCWPNETQNILIQFHLSFAAKGLLSYGVELYNFKTVLMCFIN